MRSSVYSVIDRRKYAMRFGTFNYEAVLCRASRYSIWLSMFFSTALKVIEKCEAVFNRNRV